MGSPRAPEQQLVERRLAAMMANAGLRTTMMRPSANGFELTVTRANEFSALFTVHAAFYTGHAQGCVRRPDENPSAGAPLYRRKAGASDVPRERTFNATGSDVEAFEPLLRMVAVEASAYAPPALDATGIDGVERELLDAMRMAVTEDGAPALLARLHGFLVDRARETNDPALLEDALAALNGTAPAPAPR